MRLAVTYTRFAGLDPPPGRELERDMERDMERDGFPLPLRARIQRFRQPADRMARLAAYRLLRAALADSGLGADPLEALQWDPYGRPFIASLREVDFNLSHSGGLAVCAVAWGGRTGIDVERIRGIARAGFQPFFPPSEWRRLESAADPLPAFFESWTRLESVAKAEGFGLAGPLGAIEFTGEAARVNGRAWALLRIDTGPGYCCHAAAWPAPEDVNVAEVAAAAEVPAVIEVRAVIEAATAGKGTVRREYLTAHAAGEKQEGISVHG